MKIFKTSNIAQLDAYTIEYEPISSVGLMERAALASCKWLINQFPDNYTFHCFCGFGNNGGDGLAIARLLESYSRHVQVYLVTDKKPLSPDNEINLSQLIQSGVTATEILSASQIPALTLTDVVIDALFGAGLKRPLDGLFAQVIEQLNASTANKIAIDIPSGLFGEENLDHLSNVIFKAHYTLTFEFPYLSFLFAENLPYVGSWQVLPIGLHSKAKEKVTTCYALTTHNEMAGSLRQRGRFDHKGRFGHALLIAGSNGMSGAAILAGKACLRSGAGLVTIHTATNNYTAVQSALPEAMCSTDIQPHHVSGFPEPNAFSAVAAGPGLGKHVDTAHCLFQLLHSVSVPLVLDADALNLLATHPEWFEKLPPSTILTPHPGEFDRLAGPSASAYERLQKAITFATSYGVVVVLKGAYTAVIDPAGQVQFNSTGNPGMATAGSGDVLTGIILSLLAQGYSATEAAVTGVFIHGLAGDLALQTQSEESLISSDLIAYLGPAFKQLQLTN